MAGCWSAAAAGGEDCFGVGGASQLSVRTEMAEQSLLANSRPNTFQVFAYEEICFYGYQLPNIICVLWNTFMLDVPPMYSVIDTLHEDKDFMVDFQTSHFFFPSSTF